MDQSSSHIIIFDKNNNVLLVKRSNKDEWEPGKWAIPGGKREEGESLLQNICRETEEEVSLTLNPSKIKFLKNISKKLNHVFFTTNIFSGNVKLGDKEHSEFRWVNPKEIRESECVPNLQQEIKEARLIMSGLKLVIGEGIREGNSGNDMEEDLLPGGLGDNAKPNSFDPQQILMGLKVEMEHTKEPKIALEIVLDHLTEDPGYYTKLKSVETQPNLKK